MSQGCDTTAVSSDSQAFVAPLLPPTAPPPEPARGINFVKAFSLFWLFPKRLGPHLAVGSWTRALAAHGVALVMAAAVLAVPLLRVYVGEIPDGSRPEITLEAARLLLADWILTAAAESTTWSWASAAAVPGALPLFEVGLLLLATLTMPAYAGGDSALSVWKRSVKRFYWSTTILVPIAVIVAGLIAVGQNLAPDLSDFQSLALALGFVATMGAGAVLHVRMLLAGAGQYVGEPAGPAFASREPTCDECGYAIVHLPLENRCPECGLPLRDSLPRGRRQPTRWQTHEFRPRGFLELLRLQWVILREPDFFRQVHVHSGLSSALHFAWASFGVMCLVMLLLIQLACLAMSWGQMEWEFWRLGPILLACGFVPFVLQSVLALPLCLWAHAQLGIRDYRVVAVVLYYGTPYLWPLTLVNLMVVFLLVVASGEPPAVPLFTSAWPDYLAYGVACACGATVLGAVVFWIRRLTAALRAVRHANV